MEDQKEKKELKEEALEEVKAKKVGIELVTGKRDIEIEGFGIVTILHPSLSISQECERIYSEKFIQYLNENKLPTINQLERTLEERNIWGPEQDAELENLSTDLISLSLQLSQSKLDLKTVEKKSKKKLEDKIADLGKKRILAETKLVNKSMYHNQLLESTIERRAEKDALFYKMFECTKNVEGNSLFKNMEDMLNQHYGNSVERLAVACLNFWGGIEDPLFEEQLEEMIGS
jgi:hypothetical protein